MADEQKNEAAAPADAKAAEKPQEKARPSGKAARPTNCAACNKSVKKKQWYYRNGKSYCTKTCWKTTVKKEEPAAADAVAAAAPAPSPEAK